MVGILVSGNNHFVLRGPLPDRDAAQAMVRHWSIIEIGRRTPDAWQDWRISTKEFREDLQWAVVVPGHGEVTGAVTQLLSELSDRGIAIRNAVNDSW